MTEPINEFEVEIRFLKHLIAMCNSMIRIRKESIKRVKASKKIKIASNQTGGYARAKKLSPERRTEIAKTAARARWEKR